MREFWKKLKSVKLAIVLIATIAVGSLLATLIPQGGTSEEYFKLYPKLIAELVTQTGLTRYFRSILFLIPIFLFFINLGACSLDRFLRELHKKGRRRHGPDILHVGLLLLIVDCIVSFSGRAEGSVRLSEGESVELPGGEVLRLVSFTDSRYADGRPKDWTSVVSIAKDGKPLKENVEIRVNKPLRIGNVSLYQASYASDLGVVVTDPAGKTTRLAKGETFEDKGFSVFFMTTEAPKSMADRSVSSGRMRLPGASSA